MNLREFFTLKKSCSSASTAKERLQILIAHERLSRSCTDFLPEMKKDILSVVEKYIKVAENAISVRLERDGEYSTLEVNVQLPEKADSSPQA